MSKKIMDCYVIGETGLAIKCSEILLEKDYNILGIISRDESVQNWATKKHIPIYPSFEEAIKFLKKTEFDFLFNIANSYSLPTWLINKPRQLAINYHESSLPYHGSAYPTSWAILNNEKTHGIAWYTMTEKPYIGDILKRSEFAVSNNDTALSLNVKCYEQSIKEFIVLADELIQGKVNRIPQTIPKRAFVSEHKKPMGGGILDWSSSSEVIDRLCRASDFGSYPNSFFAPKLVIAPGAVYTPQKCKSLSINNKYKAGEILSITDSYMEMAAQEGAIQVHSFLDQYNNELSSLEIKNRHGLIEKKCLPIFSKEYLKKFTEKLEEYSSYEPYWLNEWKQVQPCQLP